MNQQQPQQPMQQQQQQQPQIESKNLMILEDQMNHEALALKKCELYAQYFTDVNLKNSVNQIAQHHKQHFENLLQYLNTHQ